MKLALSPGNCRRRTATWFVGAVVFVAFGSTLLAQSKRSSPTVRDALWVWGTPELTKPGEHTAASFAQASPAQRARILDVPNVLMAGAGLPHDRQLATLWNADVAGLSRVVWEILSDGHEEHQPPFEFTRRIADLAHSVKQNPRIEAVLLDDMTSVAATKGFKPEHLKAIKSLLSAQQLPLKLWGVLYTMNFSQPTTDPLVRELDVINLWHWHAKDTLRMAENVAECEKRYPGKPIVLGLYLHDYGGGQPIPLDVHQKQCETALRLLHEKRVAGIVFLSIDNDEPIVKWTADWINRVGGATIGEPQPAPPAAEQAPPADSPVRTSHPLKIGNGDGWSFSGAQWDETAEGVISPPDQRNLHSRAFYTAATAKDFSAEFEFNGSYREVGSGGAGLVFRAQDANHFYAVYFPWGGQQLRATHFWASVVKVDGDAYLRSLKSAWVPGVPSQTDRWYQVRVDVAGSKIAVWVDGRHALDITDDSFRQGAVGFLGFGMYHFRNIRIHGDLLAPPAWDGQQAIPVQHFNVGLDSQNMPSGCIAPNGDVLLAAGNLLVRSNDKGRTWGKPETLPDTLGTVTDYGNTMFRTSKGRLLVQMWRDREQTKQPVPQIHIAESSDNGLTWGDPVASEVAGGWPEVPAKLVPYGPLVETQDGTLLRFLLGGAPEGSRFTNVVTWGSIHAKAFVIRSTDGGKSWSGPIELDQPSWSGTPRGTIPGSLDLTEPTGVAIGNRVMVLVRPIYSPMMWQCWSGNAGASWDAAARTTFPGYAQSMLRTSSGVIVCAHRYPHYSVHLSRDDGLNWDEGTVIDYAFWAMGCVVEVEPDIVLCTYMNQERNAPLLAQLFRVTPEGIRPLVRGGSVAAATKP